ncbi:alpha/beta-hydrolase N-terminal domain-containing protein, partial [Rhodococcus koreensis]
MSESDTTQSSAPEPHTEEAAKPAATPDWWKRRYTFTGTAVGLVFVWLSMTPSLLPRGPLFQGLVSGAAGAIGYAIGVFAVWLVRYMASKDASPPARRVAWIVLIVVGVVGMIAMVVWFHVWQDHVRDLMGVPRLNRYDYLLTPVLALVVLFVLVEIGQLIGRLIRYLIRQLNRVAPPRVSAVVAVLLVAGLGIALLNGVVVRLSMHTLNSTFAAVNNEQSPDTPAPVSPLRSGGPGSLVSWDSLGHQGRVFVDGGPTTAQLSAFNGAPAVEPIRAYAGLNSADGIQATA